MRDSTIVQERLGSMYRMVIGQVGLFVLLMLCSCVSRMVDCMIQCPDKGRVVNLVTSSQIMLRLFVCTVNKGCTTQLSSCCSRNMVDNYTLRGAACSRDMDNETI
jgi:hypothetical protein